MTRNKFTSEEDNLIVDRIRKNPYNLKARFEEIAEELGTHPAVSIQKRYYRHLKGVCFVSIGQIRRICALINNDMKAKMDEREVKLSKTHERIEAYIKEDTLLGVSLLPWYKRLWFKPEYVK